MRVIIDIEANGLLHQATEMHCLVAKDIDSGSVYKFYPGMPGESKDADFIHQSLHFLSKCTTIIAHNGITFDYPFLKKMFDWTPSPDCEMIDTLVMSRHLNADRARVEGSKGGPHSVESWGLRLGRWKPDHTDWSVFSPEMLHRCEEDVEIQHLIYQELCREADIIDPKLSIFDTEAYGSNNWSRSMRNEHMSAEIMFEQEENGCYFDKESAEEHLVTLDNYIQEIEDELLKTIPQTPKQKGVSIHKPFKKNGEHTKAVFDWYESPQSLVSGPFSRVEWLTINLGSDVQVKRWLLSIGWVPTQYNHSTWEFNDDGKPKRTSPKLTPDSFDSLPDGLGDSLKRRSMASHRRSQIAGWIGHTRDDHRISASANAQGTPTGRMKHRVVANVPKANSDKETGELVYFPKPQGIFFGTEMRDLFCAAPGKVLVGRDAAGIELRCFAHYINDPDYTNVIVNGDIHTHNQEMAGLPTRDMAKTFIYGWLYGAGDAKIGSIVLPDATLAEQKAKGKALKDAFLAANPRLSRLIKDVKKASRRGWLRGLDGRKIMMRSFDGRIQEHKALNTLLQCAGAVIMTEARIWVQEQLIERNLLNNGAVKVLDYHDEETYECDPEVAEEVAEILVESIRWAGKKLKMNCPLDADAQQGNSWACIH
jgi:DNA polymerase I-like protein with 3'-5' exonuclease and polymerase domains